MFVISASGHDEAVRSKVDRANSNNLDPDRPAIRFRL
jgi:hypothetical protein